MDIKSLIAILVAIVVVYLFIKFVVSPVLRLIFSVIVFLFLLYILNRFTGFDFNQILSSFGISFNLSKWNINMDWILDPINNNLDKIIKIFSDLWENVPKLNNIKQ